MALAHHAAEDVADAFERLAAFARTGSVLIDGAQYAKAVKDIEVGRLFLAAYKLEIDRVRLPSTITLNPVAMELAVKYEGP